jgi:hypothetical protein
MVAALDFLVGHPCQFYTENNIRVSPLEQTPTCKYENALRFFLLAISLFCSHALQDSSASTALNTHVRRLRSTKFSAPKLSMQRCSGLSEVQNFL